MPVELAVIFDLDGLLADTEPLWTESARRLLARRGLRYTPALKARTIGRHPIEVMGIYREAYHLQEEPAALAAERFALLRELYEAELRPMPGAPELVSALAAERVPMAVASSSPASLIELVLERLELGRFGVGGQGLGP
jgi:beta-phosphoglucomutase-like phosphatase (HAD superfamily)